MYYLIYFSTAAEDVGADDVLTILEKSRERNKENGITGLLIYHEGSFIQMLEGSTEAVEDTYARISQDPRHTRVTRVFAGETDKRYFPEWKMAFEEVDNNLKRKIDGFEPLSRSVAFVDQNQSEHMAIKMLHYFYELKFPPAN